MEAPLPSLPLLDPLSSTSMPESWVRGAIAVRINSLIRGHSGVRWELIERMADLLHENITPLVPLRGSISASGGKSSLPSVPERSDRIYAARRPVAPVLRRRYIDRESVHPRLRWSSCLWSPKSYVLYRCVAKAWSLANHPWRQRASRYVPLVRNSTAIHRVADA